MSAGQGEVAAVMIEIDIIPTGRIMASRAVCAELTVMGVILLVTGNASCRCAFKLLIDMA